MLRHLSQSEIEKFRGEQWRMRIVNYWRPLNPVIQDTPLALCDRRSVRLDEPIPCDKVMEDYVDESYYLKHEPSHDWYYLPNQTRDEPVVFVVWDSKEDKEFLVGPPHACFELPNVATDTPKRESIEVRFIVITAET